MTKPRAYTSSKADAANRVNGSISWRNDAAVGGAARASMDGASGCSFSVAVMPLEEPYPLRYAEVNGGKNASRLILVVLPKNDLIIPSLVWKKTKKWKPARPNTGSGGGPVEHCDTGELGFAKAQSPQCENVASDLAKLVAVPVPSVVLDQVEGDARTHAVSSLHGKESVDVPLLRERFPSQFDSMW